MAAADDADAAGDEAFGAVGGGGEGIVDGAGGGVDADRGGEVHVGDEADGSGGIPAVMNDPDPSVTALTFSIQNSYRHPSAGLEEFLTKADPAEDTWTRNAPPSSSVGGR